MKIQEQDIYHGAALTQIAEHESFKALNKATTKYGHYLINADTHVFVKYRTKAPFVFNFSPAEIAALEDVGEPLKLFVALVCGQTTICSLSRAELSTIMDLTRHSTQTIRVEAPASKSCRVHGTLGTMKGTIAHNSFPRKLFE